MVCSFFNHSNAFFTETKLQQRVLEESKCCGLKVLLKEFRHCPPQEKNTSMRIDNPNENVVDERKIKDVEQMKRMKE